MRVEIDLVDEQSPQGHGWARFDYERKHRYRLARALTEPAQRLTQTFTRVHSVGQPGEGHRTEQTTYQRWLENEELTRVVFVMFNPSTASAWKDDRTIEKCIGFATRWSYDVLEVVNLFSVRTPYPEDVRQTNADDRGGGPTNDEQILAALQRPNVKRVVAAWGRLGAIDTVRTEFVTGMLQAAREMHGFELLALKKLPGGAPIHPLSRGKEFIPYTIEPVQWP